VAEYGGDVSGLVPDLVLSKLNERLSRLRREQGSARP
jgi:hypothetical protein